MNEEIVLYVGLTGRAETEELYEKNVFGSNFFGSMCLGGCTYNNARVEYERNDENISGEFAVTKCETETLTDNIQSETKQKKEDTDCSYDALNAFSYRLFQENMNTQNPVLSPVSAYLALSMAGMGAKNHTKEEFEFILGVDSDVSAICGSLMNTRESSSQDTIVTLANSAWIDDEFTVSDNWLAAINEEMYSEVFHMNLEEPDTVNSINEWTADRTNGLIKNMVGEPFDSSTSLVLFNAVYFNAKWENSFASDGVYDDIFYLEDESTLNTLIMHKESNIEYISNDFAEGVILPYKNTEDSGKNFAFVALKPIAEDVKVRDMCNDLTEEVILGMIENEQTIQVNIKLPKFEMNFEGELNDSLKNIGLKDAFDAVSADFGKIGESQSGNNIFIDSVRQKSKIIVDEEGTEAAAATGIVMTLTAARPEEAKNVWFDRPFVYIIMDMDKEIPLFIGIFDNPAAS